MSSTKNNIFLAVFQSIVNVITLFIVYKYIIIFEEIEILGLWSLVVAVSSFSRLSEMGMASTTTKYIAKYKALGQSENIVKVITTSSTMIIPVVVIFTVILYVPAYLILENILSTDKFRTAEKILPYSLLSAAIGTIANVYLFSLDGLHRVDTRAKVRILCSIIYLVFVVLLTPAYGIIGVIHAQLIHTLALLCIAFFCLRSYVPKLPLIPIGWSKSTFKEIIGYGMKMQLTGVTNFLLEPLTKILFGKYGDLASLAMFEIANKCVLQLRSLGIAANQALVPKLAELAETTNKKNSDLEKVSKLNHNIAVGVAVGLYPSLIASAYILSFIFFGNFNQEFNIILMICAFAWFCNSLSQAAYFSNLGTGNLNGNLYGHFVITAVNLVLGFSLGYQFGSNGVMIAWLFGIVSGSLTTIYIFNRGSSWKTGFISNVQSIILILNISGVVLLNYFINSRSETTFSYIDASFTIFVCFLFMIIPLLFLYVDLKKYMSKSSKSI